MTLSRHIWVFKLALSLAKKKRALVLKFLEHQRTMGLGQIYKGTKVLNEAIQDFFVSPLKL